MYPVAVHRTVLIHNRKAPVHPPRQPAGTTSRTLRDCDAAAPCKLLSVCARRGWAPEGHLLLHVRALASLGKGRGRSVLGAGLGLSGQAKGQGRGWISPCAMGAGTPWGRTGCSRGLRSGRSFNLGRRAKEGPWSGSYARWRTLWPGWPHS